MAQLSVEGRGARTDRWLSLVVLAATAIFTCLLYIAVLAT
jgi:hypothetical protein